MDSILKQLKKYQPTIDVSAEVEQRQRVFRPYEEIIRRLVSESSLASTSDYERCVTAMLSHMHDYVQSSMVGRLFPIEVDIAYHLYFRHGQVIMADAHIDDYLMATIAAIGESAYIKFLAAASDEMAVKLMLARTLLATHCTGPSELDIMPKSYRNLAASKLGCGRDAKTASRVLDSLTAAATIDQKIVGRLLYIAAKRWSDKIPKMMGMLECSDFE